MNQSEHYNVSSPEFDNIRLNRIGMKLYCFVQENFLLLVNLCVHLSPSTEWVKFIIVHLIIYLELIEVVKSAKENTLFI